MVSIPTSLCKLVLPLRVQKQLETSTAKLEFAEKCLAAYHQVTLPTSILIRLLIYRSLRPDDVDERVKLSRCRSQKHMVSGARVLSFPPFAFVGSEFSNSSPGRFTPGKRAPYAFTGEDLWRTGQSCLRDGGNVVSEACPRALLTIFLTMPVLLWR